MNTLERDHEMNTNTVVDMRQFVEARNGAAFTTSQRVAEAFGKQHHHVMQKLDALDCSEHFLTSNFSRVQFKHRGNTYEACEMTKDGFMFLVMGFTGKKAAQIKEGYIDAFNWMAGQLGINSTDLVGSVIGTSGVNVLDRVIDQKASPVPPGLQRSFKHTMKSRLRSRFNVQRTDLIPADALADACNFVAAYALEGEWLGKEPKHQPNLSYPIATLVERRESMLTVRNNTQAWLDVTLHDLRDIRGSETPCEKLLGELSKAGYDIEGCWWELRTYRNKVRELASFAIGLNRAIEDPHRYAVSPNSESA